MNNVPVIVQQIRENMLDPNTSEHVRFNNKTTMENIKAFCEKSLFEYNRAQLKKGKR